MIGGSLVAHLAIAWSAPSLPAGHAATSWVGAGLPPAHAAPLSARSGSPAQAGLPTVGDTVWVRRTIPAPPGRAVRAAEWNPQGEIEVLGHPRITVRGDSVEVAYPVTIWAPGAQTVSVPGPLLVGGDGRVDSLPPASVTLNAASVLPPGPHDTLRPQPTTPPVSLRERSLQPLLLLWALALVLLAPLHLLWRRRSRPVSVAPIGPEPPEPDPARWADAGEPRAVLGVAVARLRDAIAARVPDAPQTMDTEACLTVVAERQPGWPLPELRDLLRALDEARFAHGAEVDAVGMYRHAIDLGQRLQSAAP